MEYIINNKFKNSDKELVKVEFNKILGKIMFNADNSLSRKLNTLKKWCIIFFVLYMLFELEFHDRRVNSWEKIL